MRVLPRRSLECAGGTLGTEHLNLNRSVAPMFQERHPLIASS
jgi:hypothetical protein